jgi:16S rRNA processing protein RimM
MEREGYFYLGKIVKAHGLKGALQIVFETANPDDYLDLESIFVEHKQRLIPFFIEEFSLQGKNKGLIKFEDLTTIEQAKNYTACALYIKEDEVSENDHDDAAFFEIIGYKIIDENLGDLGLVSDYYEKVGQDLLAFEYQGQEALIPVAESIVLEIDADSKTVKTRIPEGLLEIYLSKETKPDDEN